MSSSRRSQEKWRLAPEPMGVRQARSSGGSRRISMCGGMALLGPYAPAAVVGELLTATPAGGRLRSDGAPPARVADNQCQGTENLGARTEFAEA